MIFENINSLKDYVSHDDGESFDPSLSIRKAWIQKDFKFVMQRMVGN